MEELNRIRFKYDIHNEESKYNSFGLDSLRDNLYQNALLIDSKSTPLLDQKLKGIYEKFGIDSSNISAFISQSHEIQASCISVGSNGCILTFTSALLNLLDIDEFAFVAGHELGHHIYDHCRISIDKESADYFMQMRAQEISVDRIGLISAGDLDVSIRALMKTATGLNSKFLSFDVGQFISQIKKVSKYDFDKSLNNTHPSMMIRCKALLWFNLCNSNASFPLKINNEELDKMNERVQSDLLKFVDGPVQEKISKLSNEVKMWSAVILIMEDQKFDKNEQAEFSKLFGEEALRKVIGFLKLHDSNSVICALEDRLKHCSENLINLSPNSYAKLKGTKLRDTLRPFINKGFTH